jgi:hypothetical protein
LTGDRRVESFRLLAESILALPGGVRLVAVDGYGGAGKSTFAARLAAALDGAAVVHTDDFATGEPGVEWWPRLQQEVIVPLSAGATARYRRWDWEAKRLAEWHTVEPMPAVVIEGVSSARRAAAGQLAYAIWVDAPGELRLERGEARVERVDVGLADLGGAGGGASRNGRGEKNQPDPSPDLAHFDPSCGNFFRRNPGNPRREKDYPSILRSADNRCPRNYSRLATRAT